MHRGWSRDRPFGGKMLKHFFLAALMMVSMETFACWKVEGSFAVDGESWKIDQKFDYDKEYLFPMGSFILKLMLKKGQANTSNLAYTVQEKKGTSLTLVTKGIEEDIKEKEKRDIFAKGEEGQPNSIISIRLISI